MIFFNMHSRSTLTNILGKVVTLQQIISHLISLVVWTKWRTVYNWRQLPQFHLSAWRAGLFLDVPSILSGIWIPISKLSHTSKFTFFNKLNTIYLKCVKELGGKGRSLGKSVLLGKIGIISDKEKWLSCSETWNKMLF